MGFYTLIFLAVVGWYVLQAVMVFVRGVPTIVQKVEKDRTNLK